ncbi:MAG: AAA family ATPase, partial [Anaerolineae bacterium]
RFLIALSLGYPDFADEVAILEREEHSNPLDAVTPALSLPEVLALQRAARQVEVAHKLKTYIVSLVTATRTHPDVIVGVSPRGSSAMQRCVQALALIRGRTFATPDDIKDAARAVMPHRMLTRDRRAETAGRVLDEVLAEVPVPVR